MRPESGAARFSSPRAAACAPGCAATRRCGRGHRRARSAGRSRMRRIPPRRHALPRARQHGVGAGVAGAKRCIARAAVSCAASGGVGRGARPEPDPAHLQGDGQAGRARGGGGRPPLPGDLEVGFTEWKVPTLGQRARDPVEAPDGTIWWAGQWGNLIGRIDPATGEMKEYPLPADAMPHSVTIDDAGMVWYTGNQNGSVGKFDPTAEEITVYPMPDPAARDPRPAHRSVRRGRDPVVHVAAEQHGRSPRSSDRRGSPCDSADRAGAPLRHQDRRRRRAVGRLQRQQLPAQGRPGEDGADRSQAADPADHRPTPGHRRRRHDLVRQLVTGPSRTLQPADRRDRRMAVA